MRWQRAQCARVVPLHLAPQRQPRKMCSPRLRRARTPCDPSGVGRCAPWDFDASCCNGTQGSLSGGKILFTKEFFGWRGRPRTRDGRG